MRVHMHCTFSCAKRGYGGDLVFINQIKDLIFNAIYSLCGICESLGIKCHEASYNYIVVSVFFFSGGGGGVASLLGLSVFTCEQKRGSGGHLDFNKSILCSLKATQSG